MNVLRSRAKGFEIDEAVTVIGFNPYFLSADFDVLLVLLRELASLGVVDVCLAAAASGQIHELKCQFAGNEAYF